VGRPVAHRQGKGWRGGFVLSAAEQYLKLDLTKNFKVIRDLELLPQLLGQDWSGVFLQRFDGVVTIWPKTQFMDWIRILSDPDREELERMIRVGQMVTWPKLHMIENRFRLEREILRGRQFVRRAFRSGDKTPLPKDLLLSQGSASAAGPSEGPLNISLLTSHRQLSIESDAETAFARGEDKFFKKRHHLPPKSPATSSHDPLANTVRRRNWATSLLSAGGSSKKRKASPPPVESPGLLSRLRNKSFPSFPSPFSNFRRAGSKSPPLHAQAWNEDGWSSDSSSVEDDFPEDENLDALTNDPEPPLPVSDDVLNSAESDVDGVNLDDADADDDVLGP